MKLPFRLLAIGLLALAPVASAQWITQSFELKGGWTAIYLHVDATHATLKELVDADGNNPIEEVWLWNPAMSAQFTESPQVPSEVGSQWASWIRTQSPSSSLQRMIGNAAYLVRLPISVSSYTWHLKGKPVAPRYQWTSTGLNFLGFPTPSTTPPSLDSFLNKDSSLYQNAQIFRYVGGNLGTGNPIQALRPLWRNTPVRRGEAYWLRTGSYYNSYFGPFEVILQDRDGIDFRDSLSQHRLRLRNLTSAPLTVTLERVASEAPPSGQPMISGIVPLLLRGELNTTNLTYGFTRLSAGPQSLTLAPKGEPGSEMEVVIGLNRLQMPGSIGDSYAGILRFTDSFNLSQVDVPVSATVASRAGLWLGDASITQVQHYLKSYLEDESGQPVTSTNGQYVVTGINTEYGAVARPFPLRLILHDDEAGNTVLLQRAYYGFRFGTNQVLTTDESLLDPQQLGAARRFTAVHLPWTESNVPWPFNAELMQGATLTANVNLDYRDQASNPFVHSYHPDHDNLNPTFDLDPTRVLPQGDESYSVNREITLSVTAPGGDFASLTTGNQTLAGDYEEKVTIRGQGSEAREFDVRGHFTLVRVSDIGTLTTQ